MIARACRTSRHRAAQQEKGGMTVKGARNRSRAEIVFLLIRVLIAGRLLWGGGLSLAGLRPLLGADSAQVGRALEYLLKEGLVMVDRRLGTVCLTDRGFRELSS
jgi:hypothetical protein